MCHGAVGRGAIREGFPETRTCTGEGAFPNGHGPHHGRTARLTQGEKSRSRTSGRCGRMVEGDGADGPDAGGPAGGRHARTSVSIGGPGLPSGDNVRVIVPRRACCRSAPPPGSSGTVPPDALRYCGRLFGKQEMQLIGAIIAAHPAANLQSRAGVTWCHDKLVVNLCAVVTLTRPLDW